MSEESPYIEYNRVASYINLYCAGFVVFIIIAIIIYYLIKMQEHFVNTVTKKK